MALTATELVFRALRKARNGQSPSESKIYDDNAWLLVKPTMKKLAVRSAMNSRFRPLLVRFFTPVFASGIADIGGSAFDGLLREGLRWASLFEPEDTLQTYPYIYCEHYQDVRRAYRNPLFGYWGLGYPNTIYSRKKGIASQADALYAMTGTATIQGIYIPDFTGVNPFPSFVELEEIAVSIMADMLISGDPIDANE